MSSASTPYLAGFLFIWGRVSVPMSTYETVPWGSNHLLLNGIGSLGHIMTKDKGYVCWSVNPSSVQLSNCISLISTIKPTVLEGIYTNFPIQGSPPVEQIKKNVPPGFWGGYYLRSARIAPVKSKSIPWLSCQKKTMVFKSPINSLFFIPQLQSH